MAFDKNAYDVAYIRQNCDKVTLLLPRGKKAIIRKYAKEHGTSMNKAIIECIEQCTGLDLSSK